MKDKLWEAALFYRRDCGYSIVPIKFEPEENGGIRKKPLIKWAQYQTERPTVEEINRWFDDLPVEGIAVVTGKISGIFTLDLDTYKPTYDKERTREAIGGAPEGPAFRTPRGGWQFLIQYPPEGVRCINDLLPGVDVKGEGGLATMPPSVNGKGAYKWVEGRSLQEAAPAAAAGQLLLYINKYIYRQVEVKSGERLPMTSLTSNDFQFFTQGRRDEDLFTVANSLVRSGVELPFVEKALELLALGCTPPFDLREIPAKIKSALDRSERRERNIAAEVREWVLTSSGFFLTSDCFQRLLLTSREDKKAATLEFLKLHKAGVIERYGNKNGCYRRVETEVEVLDFTAAPSEEFKIDLPLNLSGQAVINPKNIIVFAGSKDAGKTALALDLVKRNAGQLPIVYVTSEMGATELRKRLEAHKDMTLEKWKVAMTAVYRADGWPDLVDGERKLFIFDYLEPPEQELYRIGTILRAIHEKLKDGVAVCFIQKKHNEILGRGGQFTLDKSRLYVGLDPGRPNRAKIISCKAFRSTNPRGMVLDYKIFGGWRIEPQGYWKHEEVKP